MDDLYFIECPGGRIKIGRAKDPYKRLRTLQTGHADELEMLAVITGRGYEEKVWHWAFCDSEIKGEWFQFTDELDWAIACAMEGKPWWDHLTPPASFPLSEDPEEHDDDFVDWQIGVHIAVVGAAEKAGLSPRQAGKNIFDQNNEPFTEWELGHMKAVTA